MAGLAVGPRVHRSFRVMRERALIEVTTGSRLHFGLLELASEQPLRFGGLGVMLDEPGWVLRCSILQDADADDLARIPRLRGGLSWSVRACVADRWGIVTRSKWCGRWLCTQAWGRGRS